MFGKDYFQIPESASETNGSSGGTGVVSNITESTTNTGYAANADNALKLGNTPSASYALKTDIPIVPPPSTIVASTTTPANAATADNALKLGNTPAESYVTSSQVVPSAAYPGRAANADYAANAGSLGLIGVDQFVLKTQIAPSASTLGNAATADNALQLGGQPASFWASKSDIGSMLPPNSIYVASTRQLNVNDFNQFLVYDVTSNVSLLLSGSPAMDDYTTLHPDSDPVVDILNISVFNVTIVGGEQVPNRGADPIIGPGEAARIKFYAEYTSPIFYSITSPLGYALKSELPTGSTIVASTTTPANAATADNALKLGNTPAASYALKTDIPAASTVVESTSNPGYAATADNALALGGKGAGSFALASTDPNYKDYAAVAVVSLKAQTTICKPVRDLGTWTITSMTYDDIGSFIKWNPTANAIYYVSMTLCNQYISDNPGSAPDLTIFNLSSNFSILIQPDSGQSLKSRYNYAYICPMGSAFLKYESASGFLYLIGSLQSTA